MADSKDTDGKANDASAPAASEMKPEKPAAKTETDSKTDTDSKAAAEEKAEPAAATVEKKAEPAAATVEKKATPEAGADKKAPVEKAPAKKAPVKKAPAKKAPAKKATARKSPAAKKQTGRKASARKTPAASKARASKSAASTEKAPTITELKEKIMANKTNDVTDMMSKSMTEAVSEMQAKAQESYAKTTSMVSEMTEVAKGNVEAFVESSKIVAAGMQDMGKTYADEAKSAYETITADMKEMAAVKSPTELFQLQGKIMRRNFDALVATSSKNSETAMKLANDAMAPLSSRVNVTVEKLSKVA